MASAVFFFLLVIIVLPPYSQMLALNIYETFYGKTGFEGVGQAKAVMFFIAVAVIALLQLSFTSVI